MTSIAMTSEVDVPPGVPDEGQATDSDGYRPGLGRRELIDELRLLLSQERAVEGLICRYLADLADAVEREQNVLGAHADVYHLAEKELGLGVRQTRERIRMGRALRELPAIEQAFSEGRLSYSRTRELTRVAQPADEQLWLAEAWALPMRELERRVVEAGGREGRDRSERRERGNDCWDRGVGPSQEAELRHPTHDVVELRITLPAEVAALLERAMRGAKRASERPMSDAQALEAIARDALAVQGSNAGGEMFDQENASTRDSSAVTQGGSRPDEAMGVEAAVTQGGSRDEGGMRDALPPPQSKVLAAMGRRGGWHPDNLCEVTGLRIQEVHVALTHLMLAGRVAQGWDGNFMACG